uniref:F-box domain-containing protein n=1 Tax=Caenorhabditis tropicalis TaxID=1561998 RepID=A0A1I7TPH9_9PELO
MTTIFPLLKVTDVVFDEILIHLELNEIFNLSLCSPKTRDIVRCHMKKSIRYPLYLDTKENDVMKFGFIGEKGKHVPMMSVRQSKNNFMRNYSKNMQKIIEKFLSNERQSEIVSMKGYEEKKVKISKYDDHYALISNNDREWMDGCILVLVHITDLFRNTIDTLYCNNPYTMKFKYNAPLRMTYAGGEEFIGYWDLVEYEQEKSTKTGGLQLRTRLPKGYDFTLIRDYEYIRIERAHFARSGDVLKVAKKSREVIFDESGLLSNSLNKIFNYWLEHRIDGLKFLSIRMKSYKELSVFREIEHRISDTTEEVNYKSYTGEMYRLSPGKRLRRDDGVTALFSYDPNTRILNFGVLLD